MPLTLLLPREAVSMKFQIPIGDLRGDPQVYGPIVDALADGPRSYGDLARSRPLQGLREGAVLQALSVLVGGRQVHPFASDAGDCEPAARFNRAVLDRLAFGETPRHLASGRTGTGLGLEFEELIAVQAALSDEGAADAARRGWAIMARTGRRLVMDGAVLSDQAANEAELAERIARFNVAKLPLLRTLGVV